MSLNVKQIMLYDPGLQWFSLVTQWHHLTCPPCDKHPKQCAVRLDDEKGSACLPFCLQSIMGRQAADQSQAAEL